MVSSRLDFNNNYLHYNNVNDESLIPTIFLFLFKNILIRLFRAGNKKERDAIKFQLVVWSVSGARRKEFRGRNTKIITSQCAFIYTFEEAHQSHRAKMNR